MKPTTKQIYCHNCQMIVEAIPRTITSEASSYLEGKKYFCPYCGCLLFIER